LEGEEGGLIPAGKTRPGNGFTPGPDLFSPVNIMNERGFAVLDFFESLAAMEITRKLVARKKKRIERKVEQHAKAPPKKKRFPSKQDKDHRRKRGGGGGGRRGGSG